MISSLNKTALVTATILAFANHAALAESTTQVSAPATTSRTSQEPSALDNFYLNYFATYHGPSLNHMSSNTVDRTGAPTKLPQYLDSEVTAAYLIDKESGIGIGPVVPFWLVTAQGRGASLGDVGIKAFDKKTISTKDFNLYTNLILQLPTSDDSQKRNLNLGIKTTPNVRYSIPSTRFTVGAWTEAKAYTGVTEGKAFKLYGAPYVNYQLVKNLSLNVEYEMEADHFVGKTADVGLLNFRSYQTDLQPGFIWNITPKIMINPYFQIFTTNHANADSTALGAVMSATVL